MNRQRHRRIINDYWALNSRLITIQISKPTRAHKLRCKAYKVPLTHFTPTALEDCSILYTYAVKNGCVLAIVKEVAGWFLIIQDTNQHDPLACHPRLYQAMPAVDTDPYGYDTMYCLSVGWVFDPVHCTWVWGDITCQH